MAASLAVFVSIILSETNIQIVLSALNSSGRQTVVRRADRTPKAGVVAQTFTEWVGGFHASQYGVPAWLGDLETGKFGLTVHAPRSANTSGLLPAIKAGIAAGMPVPTPTPAVEESEKPADKPARTRRGKSKQEAASEAVDAP